MHKRASSAGTKTIGELAEQSGVGVQTVRNYERRHLLPEAARRRSNYRAFAPMAFMAQLRRVVRGRTAAV